MPGLLWVLWLAQFDGFSWERLAGLSGTAVLALVVGGLLSGKIVPGYLYREAIADRDKWCARAEDATKLLRQSVDAQESTLDQLRENRQTIKELTDSVNKGR